LIITISIDITIGLRPVNDEVNPAAKKFFLDKVIVCSGIKVW